MMYAPLWVLAAWFTVLSAKLSFVRLLVKEGYDNHNPRDQQARTEGAAKRGVAAHLNGFENFPPFASAMLFAFVTGVTSSTVNVLGGAYVVSRIVYNYLYVANFAAPRSLVWTLGSLSTIALYISAFLKLRG